MQTFFFFLEMKIPENLGPCPKPELGRKGAHRHGKRVLAHSKEAHTSKMRAHRCVRVKLLFRGTLDHIGYRGMSHIELDEDSLHDSLQRIDVLPKPY